VCGTELERKELKRQEKKRKRKEERKQKKERKRRKRHIKHHGAPLVRALRDLRPSMAGETIIVVGHVVDESEPTTIPLSEKTLEQHRTGNTAAIREALASHEGEGAEEELSVEAIARRKAKRALEQLQADADAERPSTTVEAEKTKRWEEEERQRRQAECWRTLPYLNKNQDRFRLAKDGRDVILQFDRTQEDTFLPDNTDVWVWGTLEVQPPSTHARPHDIVCIMIELTLALDTRGAGQDRPVERALRMEGRGCHDPARRADPRVRGPYDQVEARQRVHRWQLSQVNDKGSCSLPWSASIYTRCSVFRFAWPHG
jgi:hypothetical protein